MGDATLIRFMIIHYQAVLKTTLTDAARTIVLQLLAQAEWELSTAQQAHDRSADRRSEVFPNPRRPLISRTT